MAIYMYHQQECCIHHIIYMITYYHVTTTPHTHYSLLLIQATWLPALYHNNSHLPKVHICHLPSHCEWDLHHEEKERQLALEVMHKELL